MAVVETTESGSNVVTVTVGGECGCGGTSGGTGECTCTWGIEDGMYVWNGEPVAPVSTSTPPLTQEDIDALELTDGALPNGQVPAVGDILATQTDGTQFVVPPSICDAPVAAADECPECDEQVPVKSADGTIKLHKFSDFFETNLAESAQANYPGTTSEYFTNANAIGDPMNLGDLCETLPNEKFDVKYWIDHQHEYHTVEGTQATGETNGFIVISNPLFLNGVQIPGSAVNSSYYPRDKNIRMEKPQRGKYLLCMPAGSGDVEVCSAGVLSAKVGVGDTAWQDSQSSMWVDGRRNCEGCGANRTESFARVASVEGGEALDDSETSVFDGMTPEEITAELVRINTQVFYKNKRGVIFIERFGTPVPKGMTEITPEQAEEEIIQSVIEQGGGSQEDE